MEIGIRLHDTAGSNLEEHLRNAREQGFSCVHIAMSKVVPGFKMADAPELLTDALADEVRGLLEKYNQRCVLLGCYLNLCSPDLSAHERTLMNYRAHLRFGKKIGALMVGTETGAPNIGYKSCPECRTEESLRLFIERVKPVVRWAEEEGMMLAIEPVTRHIVCTAERCQRVLAEVHSENLRVILDAVNLLDRENVHQAQEVVTDAIARLCARVIQDMNPAIVLIFATAHDEYMGDAFEVYAFDYLLKPFKKERVMQTLERAKKRIRHQTDGETPLPVHPTPHPVSGRLMLHHKDGVSFLNVSDIVLVQREDRTTVFYTASGERYVTSDSLSDTEARLDSSIFFRCHKSYIVNLNHIKNITPYGRWTYIVHLQGTEQDALITHEKYEELEKMFS